MSGGTKARGRGAEEAGGADCASASRKRPLGEATSVTAQAATTSTAAIAAPLILKLPPLNGFPTQKRLADGAPSAQPTLQSIYRARIR